jgi:hypothetical protein
VVGVINLLLLGVNYAPAFGIPFWAPLALLVLAVALLVRRGGQRRQLFSGSGLRPEQRQRLQKIFVSGLAGLALGLAGGVVVFIGDWRLVFVLLPGSLAAGVVLYLLIVTLTRTAPLRFLLVPLAALLVAGLLWLIVPGLGYLNLFLLCGAALALGMALWLRFAPSQAAPR